jgi:hypothetical protein
MAGILRVAIALDRTHAGLVTEIRARDADGVIALDVVGVDGADLSLELFTAIERKDLLEEVLDRRVKIGESQPVSAGSG